MLRSCGLLNAPEAEETTNSKLWEDPLWNYLNLVNPFSLPPGVDEEFMCETTGTACPEVFA